MSKKVNFAARPATPSPAADQWVSERAAPSPAAAVPMKQLTDDLEATQHTRFKSLCAQQELKNGRRAAALLELRIAESSAGRALNHVGS